MSTNVAEVGVYKGGSSKFIASVLENENKDTKIYSCDTFTGHAVVNEQYDGEHRANQDFSDVVFSEVVDYLAEYRNIQIIKGDIFNTIDRISPGRLLGLIHLDVDVYPATKFVLENLHEKLATGGFIICDDYGFVTCLGARKAVEEFIETQKSNYLSLHLLTGQIVLVKK
jgi:O-methyltransferase